MIRTPAHYQVSQLKNWSVQVGSGDGKPWILARPVSNPGFNLRTRLRLAFRVLIGRSDVVTWGDGQ